MKDRRHFAPDGESREEPVVPEGGSTAAEPAPSPGESNRVGEPPREASERAGVPQDLTGLIVGLAAQATAHLAGEGESVPDLGGARGLITMLEILKDRTSGRLLRDEERLLDQVLFELRMAYMAAARGSS